MLGQMVLVVFSAYYLGTLSWWKGKWREKIGHGVLAGMLGLGLLSTGWEARQSIEDAFESDLAAESYQQLRALKVDYAYLDIVPVPSELQNTDSTLKIGIGVWVPKTGAHLLPQSDQLGIDSATRLIIGEYPVPMQTR